MSADLIVYALVAAGLVFWLRNILGTRHGDEKQRPNPYLTPTDNTEDSATSDMGVQNAPRNTDQRDKILALSDREDGGVKVGSIHNAAAESGLLDIARQDKSFDIDFFIEAVKDVFVYVVEAYADGDRKTLKDLLAEPVYHAFETEIIDREALEHTAHAEIQAIRGASITEAGIEDKMARITVNFKAEEIAVTKDKDGNTVSGSSETPVVMNDVWVFGRKIKSKDPRWMVLETRSGHVGDSDFIPDSDVVA